MKQLASPDNNRPRTASRPTRALSLVAALALAMVGAVALPAAANGIQVPINVSVSGDVHATTSAPSLTGSGLGSHLGLLDDYRATVGTTVDGNGVFTTVLTETFTAANGHTLTILTHQVIEPAGDGVLLGTDTWTVIGGTGRFEGAMGSGTGTTEAYNMETFSKHLTGTISY